MEAAITHLINSFARNTPLLEPVMVAITQVGVPFVVLVVLQWWSRENRQHLRHAAICAGLAFLRGLAFSQGILLFIHRLGPYDERLSHLLIGKSADGSFPSDHATASMALVMAFTLHGRPRRAWLVFAMIFFVCLSRLYVGTDYLTDVLDGVATGTSWFACFTGKTTNSFLSQKAPCRRELIFAAAVARVLHCPSTWPLILKKERYVPVNRALSDLQRRFRPLISHSSTVQRKVALCPYAHVRATFRR